MRLQVFGDPQTLDRLRVEWDSLASRSGVPYCSPVWMLSWWRQVADPTAQPRFIAGFDNADRLVGLAPFFAQRNGAGLWTYRILGAPTSPRTEPLADLEYQEEFVSQVADKLATLRPFPALVRLEGIVAGSVWARGLRAGWPSAQRPVLERVRSMEAPTVTITGTYDEWFAARTRNFRQQMRRTQRQLADRGAVVERARSSDDIRRAIAELRRLHEGRWQGRGGSSVMTSSVERMLQDIANSSDGTGRHELRLWTIRVDDRIISSQLFLSLGGEVAYWLGGFDDEWGPFRPSIITILKAIEEAFYNGDRRVDLGGGSQPYKMRFADGEDVLEWWALVPPGPTAGPARATLAAAKARVALVDKLPPDVKRLLKRVVRR